MMMAMMSRITVMTTATTQPAISPVSAINNTKHNQNILTSLCEKGKALRLRMKSTGTGIFFFYKCKLLRANITLRKPEMTYAPSKWQASLIIMTANKIKINKNKTKQKLNKNKTTTTKKNKMTIGHCRGNLRLKYSVAMFVCTPLKMSWQVTTITCFTIMHEYDVKRNFYTVCTTGTKCTVSKLTIIYGSLAFLSRYTNSECIWRKQELSFLLCRVCHRRNLQIFSLRLKPHHVCFLNLFLLETKILLCLAVALK